MTRAVWTPERDAMLREIYATQPAAECAQALGMTVTQIHYRVAKLGLRKSREWIAARQREVMQRLDHGGKKTRFQAGHATWNKGMHYVAGGKSAETRFKAGNRPHSWNPIGHTRIRSDGYMERKTADTGCTRRDYVVIHHLIWRMHGRTIPPGHTLVFRDGDKANLDINNFELITRAELMARNTVHRLPKEAARAVQMLGALRRQINKREHHA